MSAATGTVRPAAERSFLLQRVQPAMTGLIDGTLAPIFAVALATHRPHYAFVAGLATAIGAGVSMAFAFALAALASIRYDVVILDIGLPGINGYETCRRLRGDGVRTPILMLTTRDGVEERILGLDTGAADYLVKPPHFGELFARVRALARRGPVDTGPVLEVGDLTLDGESPPAGQRQFELSTKELQLLEVFMRRPGRVLSRYELLEGAWDMDYENRSNVVDVYVRYLRDKIDRPFGVQSIETVRGAGYRLRAARSPATVFQTSASLSRRLRAP